MQTHEHDLSITSCLFRIYFLQTLHGFKAKGVAAESSPREISSKIQVMYDIEG
jgi:hypothetical protein